MHLDNLDDFKDTVIRRLVSPDAGFITVYTNPDTIERPQNYINDSKHCYVMDRTFIPSGTSVPNYLYFYNDCGDVVNTGITVSGITDVNESLCKIIDVF